jgi:hypothetical protein
VAQADEAGAATTIRQSKVRTRRLGALLPRPRPSEILPVQCTPPPHPSTANPSPHFPDPIPTVTFGCADILNVLAPSHRPLVAHPRPLTRLVSCPPGKNATLDVHRQFRCSSSPLMRAAMNSMAPSPVDLDAAFDDTEDARDTTQPQRRRSITSCLTCRRRKVRCDHGYPRCGACLRGKHTCTYAKPPLTDPRPSLSRTSSGRVSKLSVDASSTPADIDARLQRLESLIKQALVDTNSPHTANDPDPPRSRAHKQTQHSASVDAGDAGDAGDGLHSLPRNLSSTFGEGALLLEDGRSHFVSSLHWALLAEKVLLAS